MKSDGKLKDFSVLEDIFLDKSDIDAVRIKAGYLIENPKLLEEAVWQDNGNVAYQALKALRFIDSDCALKTASSILENHDRFPVIKVKAAIKAKAAILSKSEYRDLDKAAFIEQCGQLREELSKSNPEMRLSIAFALTELQDMDALALILEDQDLRLNIRSFAIYENMDVIENTIERGPSQKELETLVAAVCAYPEEDGRLYELVTSAVENAPFYTQNEKSTILEGMTTPLARTDLGYISYAVYRDGVDIYIDNTWHAALMDVAYKTSSGDVVIQAKQDLDVDYGTWYEFLTGQGTGVYTGTYRPDAAMSALARGNVNARATYLVNEGIPYLILRQLGLVSNHGLSSGDKISTGDILSMRCDGVVEYCYEYYGFRVYGTDSLWDISTYGSSVITHHSYNAINPEVQATYYLTQVLDANTEPT